MNQRMYINYKASIYYLTSIYKDNLDINLKNAIRNMLHYLNKEVDSYAIPHQDKTIKYFDESKLDNKILITKTKQVMAIIKCMSNDDEIILCASELLDYIKIIEKEIKREEINNRMK